MTLSDQRLFLVLIFPANNLIRFYKVKHKVKKKTIIKKGEMKNCLSYTLGLSKGYVLILMLPIHKSECVISVNFGTKKSEISKVCLFKGF